MCFITFREHFSFKKKNNKTKPNKNIPQGNWMSDKRVKYVFKFFYGWEKWGGVRQDALRWGSWAGGGPVWILGRPLSPVPSPAWISFMALSLPAVSLRLFLSLCSLCVSPSPFLSPSHEGWEGLRGEEDLSKPSHVAPEVQAMDRGAPDRLSRWNIWRLILGCEFEPHISLKNI